MKGEDNFGEGDNGNEDNYDNGDNHGGDIEDIGSQNTKSSSMHKHHKLLGKKGSKNKNIEVEYDVDEEENINYANNIN
jgi:hypothetical protein